MARFTSPAAQIALWRRASCVMGSLSWRSAPSFDFDFLGGFCVPRMITKIVAGVVMYGSLIGVGYIPAEEKSDAGEKYYIQVTGPNLTSYKPRMTDEAYQQFQMAGGDSLPMGAPVMMSVSHSLFNGNIYWRAESFSLRPDAGDPFARPAGSSGFGGSFSSSAPSAPRAGASASSAPDTASKGSGK